MAIDDWVRRHVETTWHCLGTCSMAPREGNEIVEHGVLDPRLNVHGTKNLKVADLSICPGKKPPLPNRGTALTTCNRQCRLQHILNGAPYWGEGGHAHC
jgi:hypothetical protein